jgi:hypothetical protein
LELFKRNGVKKIFEVFRMKSSLRTEFSEPKQILVRMPRVFFEWFRESIKAPLGRMKRAICCSIIHQRREGSTNENVSANWFSKKELDCARKALKGGSPSVMNFPITTSESYKQSQITFDSIIQSPAKRVGKTCEKLLLLIDNRIESINEYRS